MARAKGIKILAGRATIYEPTENYKSWRVVYVDRATGTRKTTAGGTTREQAESKAAALLGDYVPSHRTRGEEPPTVEYVFQSWMDSKRSKWVSRTYDNYLYVGKKLLEPHGERQITQVAPRDIRKIDTSGFSRGQQEKLRTIIKSTFKHAKGWISETTADEIAQAVTITGTKSDGRNLIVPRGDIPTSKYVASLIIAASHTCQIGLLDDPETVTLDEQTGKKQRTTFKMEWAPGYGVTEPTNRAFINGLPVELIEKHRRGMPKHYNPVEKRRSDETKELAGRFNQLALVTALGAGGGLRIGEVLALRVKHLLPHAEITQNFHIGNTNRLQSNYRGKVEIEEQASQSSKGKIWVTLPKGDKIRTVNLPAFLPNWNGFGVGTHRAQIAEVVPRLSDPSASLWQTTNEEIAQLWAAGFTPLNFLIWQRLTELWNSKVLPAKNMTQKIDSFEEMLLFPTRTKARQGASGSSMVQTPSNWTNNIKIVEGTGTYQAQANYAKLANPLYDYVSEVLNYYPDHRTNSKTRRGWTHHGLRHYSISSRLKAGVPLPVIAKQAGHSGNGEFTLKRYGHVLDDETFADGFEY